MIVALYRTKLIFRGEGLQINDSKTEMIWNEMRVVKIQKKTQNVDLINRKHFKYPGVLISYKKSNIGNKEIDHEINCALEYFGQIP